MSDQRRPPIGPFGGMHGPATMGMPVEKAKDVRGTLRRLASYLWPSAPLFVLVFLASILSTAFSVVGPRMMGDATTIIFRGLTAKASGGGIDFTAIARILLALIVLYSLSAAFVYVQQYLMAGVSQNLVFRLRGEIQSKLSRLPLGYFDGRTHGEILSRTVNDVDTISGTLQQSLTQLVSSLVTILGVLAMMLAISPLLTLVGVATLPLAVLATSFVAKRSRRYFSEQQRALGELTGKVEETFSGHAAVKAFGRERAMADDFGRINERLYQAGWRAQFISGLIMPLMHFINNLGYVVVCVAGGAMAARRTLELGDIQAFIQYLRNFSQPIVQTANIANVIQSTIAAAERVFQLLDEAEEMPDAPEPLAPTAVRGEVRFDSVTFGYRPGTSVIEDLSIEVDPGQVVAIVGPTGAGKTTLVNLLMRFYEIGSGAITIDGIDTRAFARGGLRGLFGMVLQDTWLFSGTIRDNIAYGRDGAGDEDVLRAAKAAQADHFIRTLPDGYLTVLNEEASNLSQGQRQLLCIARAVLADPAVLILDEATSSVDTRTEFLIQKALRDLMADRTSFVIAHRLSTVRDAALILVMEKGRIVEQGRHGELLARGGAYARLHASQFAGKEEAEGPVGA